MSQSDVHGSCLCGAVTFMIDPPFQKMVHCHCSRCRKGTGTGHATNLIAPADQLHWLSGEDAISRYQLPGAKRFGKWFCRHCGSPLPRLTPDGKTTVIPAGSLDDSPPITPTDRIFWASRAPWSCSDAALPTHAEYPESW
jgi:hypothetical protein